MNNHVLVLDRNLVQPNTMAHFGWFNRYNPEKEITPRKLEVTEDQIEELKKAYGRQEKALSKIPILIEGYYAYEEAFKIVRRLSYSAADVTHFSIALAEFQDDESLCERGGAFLSALINASKETEFKVLTNHLSRRLDYLGYHLGSNGTKNVVIRGDVGEHVCDGMERGKLVVQGNAGGNAGDDMKGGELIIEGNSGQEAGNNMEGGELIIEGNSRQGAGHYMKGGKLVIKGYAGIDAGNGADGGEIHLDGRHGMFSPLKYRKLCKIYHKGKRIRW